MVRVQMKTIATAPIALQDKVGRNDGSLLSFDDGNGALNDVR